MFIVSTDSSIFDERYDAKTRLRFISLEDALRDKAYALPDAPTAKGLSWLCRWMLAQGEPLRPEPREPDFITRLAREYGN